MSAHDLRRELFLTPEETARLFRRDGDLKWVWRHSAPGKFLAPAKKKFGRMALFSARELERITGVDTGVVELYNSGHRRAKP